VTFYIFELLRTVFRTLTLYNMSSNQTKSSQVYRQCSQTVAPTPWGTGGTCPPTYTNGWARGHRE